MAAGETVYPAPALFDHVALFFVLFEQRGRGSSSSLSSSTTFLFLDVSGLSFHMATRSSIFLSWDFSFSFWLAISDCCAETKLSRLASVELCSEMVFLKPATCRLTTAFRTLCFPSMTFMRRPVNFHSSFNPWGVRSPDLNDAA